MAVLGQSTADVTPQGRRLLGLIRKMLTNGHAELVAGDGTASVTRRQVREYTGWSDWQVRTHLNELADLEFLHVRAGSKGKEYVYELGDDYSALWAQPAFGVTDAGELAAVLGLVDPQPRGESAQLRGASRSDAKRKPSNSREVSEQGLQP